MNRAQLHEPRQRRQLHAVVRRPGAWNYGPHPPGTPRRVRDSWARDVRARPAVTGTRWARDSRARPAVFRTRPARDARAHDGPRSNGPSSERARRAALQRCQGRFTFDPCSR